MHTCQVTTHSIEQKSVLVNTTFYGTVLIIRKQTNPETEQQAKLTRNQSVKAFLAASGASPCWGGASFGGGALPSERHVLCKGPQGARSRPALGQMTAEDRKWLA